MVEAETLDQKIYQLIQLNGADSERGADGSYHRELVLRGTGLRVAQVIDADGAIGMTFVDHTSRWLYQARGNDPKNCKREKYCPGNWEQEISRQLEIARYKARQGNLFQQELFN